MGKTIKNKKESIKMNKQTVCKMPWCQEGECYNRATIGKAAPYFEAESYFQNSINTFKLSDHLGKYVVLFFYPKDFTFVCPTEILAFSDAAPEFAEHNATLVGASCDNEHVHFAWCQRERKAGGLGLDLAVPLLADVTKCISSMYGCLFTEGPNAGVPMRATFIIDTKGILRHASYSDLPVGRNPHEVLRLVEAFQFADKHGEVCPANWKKGNPTMEPKIGSQKTIEYWRTEGEKKN